MVSNDNVPVFNDTASKIGSDVTFILIIYIIEYFIIWLGYLRMLVAMYTALDCVKEMLATTTFCTRCTIVHKIQQTWLSFYAHSLVPRTKLR